jgi:hypothetical protein
VREGVHRSRVFLAQRLFAVAFRVGRAREGDKVSQYAHGPRHAPKAVMARIQQRTSAARIASSWDATPLHARCVEPEGEPTQVIPVAVLRRLLAVTANDGTDEEGAGPEGSVPRFEIVELQPEDIVVDDSAFEER